MHHGSRVVVANSCIFTKYQSFAVHAIAKAHTENALRMQTLRVFSSRPYARVRTRRWDQNTFCPRMGKDTGWQSAEYSLSFNPNDDQLDFNDRNLDANDHYSGGLLFLGIVFIF